jgi:hypothetical protein
VICLLRGARESGYSRAGGHSREEVTGGSRTLHNEIKTVKPVLNGTWT